VLGWTIRANEKPGKRGANNLIHGLILVAGVGFEPATFGYENDTPDPLTQRRKKAMMLFDPSQRLSGNFHSTNRQALKKHAA